MEQRKIAVLQGRSKPGRVKLPKRLLATLQPLNNVDITSCACGYGWPGRKLPPSIILRQALLDLLM